MLGIQPSHFTYKIIPVETPKVIRNGEVYVCTEKFRLNSNKSYTDIWLIYQSQKDGSRWKVTLYTRIGVHKLDPELFNKFLSNNKECAWKYAFDTGLIMRCGGTLSPDIEYLIEGPTLAEILKTKEDEINLNFICDYEMPTKIRNILSSTFGLSLSALQKLQKKGALTANLTSKMGKEQQIKIEVKELLMLKKLENPP